MKTLVKTFALVLSLGFVTTAATLAETNPDSRPAAVASFKTGIYTTTSGKLNVALDKEKGGTVDILLKSPGGKILFSEHLGKKEEIYRTQLNLNELADGVYQLEVSNGVEKTTQTVTLSTQRPSSPSRVISVQ